MKVIMFTLAKVTVVVKSSINFRLLLQAVCVPIEYYLYWTIKQHSSDKN